MKNGAEPVSGLLIHCTKLACFEAAILMLLPLCESTLFQRNCSRLLSARFASLEPVELELLLPRKSWLDDQPFEWRKEHSILSFTKGWQCGKLRARNTDAVDSRSIEIGAIGGESRSRAIRTSCRLPMRLRNSRGNSVGHSSDEAFSPLDQAPAHRDRDPHI
jgi:hypothetical protein